MSGSSCMIAPEPVDAPAPLKGDARAALLRSACTCLQIVTLSSCQLRFLLPCFFVPRDCFLPMFMVFNPHCAMLLLLS